MKRWLDARLLAAATAAVVFAASAFAAIEAGLASYSPDSLALLRMLVAAAALVPYVAFSGVRLPEAKDLLAIALMGFFAFSLFNWALSYGQITASAGAASLILASIPILTSLLAVAFLKERLDAWGWAGTAVGFSGVALIIFGEEEGFGMNAGALLLLLAAVSASVYFAFQKPYLRRYGSLPFTAYVIWAGMLLLLPFLPGLIEEVRSAPPRVTFAVVYLGVSTVVAYATAAYVFSRLPASRAVTLEYLLPPVAIVIAYLWLGELPAVLSVVGGMITLLGVALVNYRRT